MGSGFSQSCVSHARLMLRCTSCMISEFAVWCATTVWCVIGRQIWSLRSHLQSQIQWNR